MKKNESQILSTHSGRDIWPHDILGLIIKPLVEPIQTALTTKTPQQIINASIANPAPWIA